MSTIRKMLNDVTFIIITDSHERIRIETYRKEFRYLNCDIPAKSLTEKMLYITKELNNHPDGCYGCLFCIE